MRWTLRALIFVALGGVALLLPACAPSMQVILTGKKHASRPANCSIRFENMDPDRAAIEYEQIGIISVDIDAASVLTDGLKEELAPRACRMGGELVVPIKDAHSWESSSAAFLVLTSRPEGSEN